MMVGIGSEFSLRVAVIGPYAFGAAAGSGGNRSLLDHDTIIRVNLDAYSVIGRQPIARLFDDAQIAVISN